MCIRYLGLVLLIWCPGELHAQSATQSCSAPTLDGGKFSPKRETYANGVYVTYSCDLGRKPAVEGWWARSTCQNGTWSPQPQCIVEEACIPPEIPNAKYTESPTGWYEDGQKIRITCDEAYELKNRDATALCTNGLWSSVPVCERSVDACGEPPKVLHAIIIDQRYQELFAADTELQYECEDGYTAEGAGNDKTIVCIAGAWTEGPTCSKAPTPSTGPGGSTEGGAGGEHTASAGSGTQPAGGGSSTSSDSNGRDSRPSFIELFHCGPYPTIANGAVVKAERMYLKYRCAAYHTLVGLDTVACYSDGSWSPPPVCKEESCVLNPARYRDFKLSGFQRLGEGEWQRVPCLWDYYYSRVQCINGEITHTQCSAAAPGTGQGGSTEGATAGEQTPSPGSGTQPAGTGTTPSTGHGGGTSGSSLQPAGGGSSTTSDSNSRPSFIGIIYCGPYPTIANGAVVKAERMHLKYRCADYHTLVGSDTVVCHSDGTWSQLPVCKEESCVLNPARYRDFKLSGLQHLGEGERRRIPCVWDYFYSVFQCINGEITHTLCCNPFTRHCP